MYRCRTFMVSCVTSTQPAPVLPRRSYSGWKAIVAKNPSLAANPDAITPGQRLTLA